MEYSCGNRSALVYLKGFAARVLFDEIDVFHGVTSKVRIFDEAKISGSGRCTAVRQVFFHADSPKVGSKEAGRFRARLSAPVLAGGIWKEPRDPFQVSRL